MFYLVIQSKHKSQIADTVNLFIHCKNDKNVKSQEYFLGIKSTERNWQSGWTGGGRGKHCDLINFFVTLCTRNNFKTIFENTPLAFVNLALKTLLLALTP